MDKIKFTSISNIEGRNIEVFENSKFDVKKNCNILNNYELL